MAYARPSAFYLQTILSWPSIHASAPGASFFHSYIHAATIKSINCMVTLLLECLIDCPVRVSRSWGPYSSWSIKILKQAVKKSENLKSFIPDCQILPNIMSDFFRMNLSK